MVGVVEEQAEAELVAQAQQPLCQRGRVPLVQDDDLRRTEKVAPLVKIGQVGGVRDDG